MDEEIFLEFKIFFFSFNYMELTEKYLKQAACYGILL